MNYSYVMGVNHIDRLKKCNFNIKVYGSNYGIVFPNKDISIFEDYICDSLKNGFWNEYLGKEKVFIFKFMDGSIKRYVLCNDNEDEILKLCCEFANTNFESIDKMLRNNEFYASTYYRED